MPQHKLSSLNRRSTDAKTCSPCSLLFLTQHTQTPQHYLQSWKNCPCTQSSKVSWNSVILAKERIIRLIWKYLNSSPSGPIYNICAKLSETYYQMHSSTLLPRPLSLSAQAGTTQRKKHHLNPPTCVSA